MADSRNRAILASIMRNNPVAASSGPYDVRLQPGRQSTNVEMVQGTDRFSPNDLAEMAKALNAGFPVSEIGRFDDLNYKNLMGFPGQIAEWTPKRALNPGAGGATMMRTMTAEPPPNGGWMTEPPVDSTKFDFGAPVGNWSQSYPYNARNRSSDFRPAYKLPKG